MSIVLLDQYLKRLRLPTIVKNYEVVAKEAVTNRVSYEEYLCCLSEQEIQAREENTKKERLIKARFPAIKTLDQFKFDEIPSLDKNLVMQLFTGKYLETAENVVFLVATEPANRTSQYRSASKLALPARRYAFTAWANLFTNFWRREMPGRFFGFSSNLRATTC